MNQEEEYLTVPQELVSPPPPGTQQYLDDLEFANQSARLAFLIASLMVFGTNLTAAVLLLDWPPSVLKNVAVVSGHPEMVPWVFVVAVILPIPFLLIQIFIPNHKWCNNTMRVASLGHVMAGVVWAGLCVMSEGLDYGYFSVSLGITATLNIAFGYMLGMTNNHSLLRRANVQH